MGGGPIWTAEWGGCLIRGTDIKTESTPPPAYLGRQFDETVDTKRIPIQYIADYHRIFFSLRK